MNNANYSPALDRRYQSRSARALSHAETPLGLALRRYDAFSAAVQRNSTRSEARSLAGTGGLPLGRFGLSIANYMPVQIILASGNG